MLNLQIHPQSPFSPVLASLRMSVELWMSLWAGHWVVETVLISTSSTLPPMIPGPHMEDFWTSPLPVSHWLVSWQASSIVSQYVVSTVGVWRGIGVNPWKLNLKVYVSQSNTGILMYVWWCQKPIICWYSIMKSLDECRANIHFTQVNFKVG